KAARGLLLWARSSEAEMNELREASLRPYSRYPIKYDQENPWAILLPHLANVKAACQRLQLQACAELAAGQTERALEDLRLMLYLVDSPREEPFLISYLVRLACLQLTMQPIWEGLADHRWSETQLQEIQARLDEYDLLTDLKRALEGERAAALLTADL